MTAIDEARRSLSKAMGGRHGDLHHGAEISVTISSATAKLELISVIEDLREDTAFFIQCAKAEQEILQRKRLVRAAFLTFNAYVEAYINQMYEAVLLDAGLGKAEIDEKLRWDKFSTKCRAVERLCTSGSKALSKPEKHRLRNVRNELVHFKKEHLDLWRRLSLEELESLHSKHMSWLGELRRVVGVHEPDTEILSDSFMVLLGAMGVQTHEPDGAVKDEV